MRMFRTILSAAVVAAVALGPSTALADMCAVDDTPAATLLIPYFEVDLEAAAAARATTRFWVRNTASRPKLAQVTVWSDWGIPVSAFYIYLPAMATQHVDMGEYLVDGKMPSTGSGVSPIGDFDSEETALTFRGCNATSDPANGLPVTPMMSQTLRTALQARLTGRPAPSDGACWGENHGDLLARGYLTIDSVITCGNTFPDLPGYTDDLDHANVLVGGFELRDPLNNFAQGGRAVAIESEQSLLVPGDQSFYGNYVAGTATDSREPLPPSWRVEFDDSGGPDGNQAELLVWRAAPTTTPRACGSRPRWFPLGEIGRRPYAVNGDTPAPPVVFPGDPTPVATPFGLATGRYPLSQFEDSLQANVNKGSGEILLLDQSNEYPNFEGGQAWVAVLHSRLGRYSEIVPGRPIDSFCESVSPRPANVSGPPVENPNTRAYLFSDDFEA